MQDRRSAANTDVQKMLRFSAMKCVFTSVITVDEYVMRKCNIDDMKSVK